MTIPYEAPLDIRNAVAMLRENDPQLADILEAGNAQKPTKHMAKSLDDLSDMLKRAQDRIGKGESRDIFVSVTSYPPNDFMYYGQVKMTVAVFWCLNSEWYLLDILCLPVKVGNSRFGVDVLEVRKVDEGRYLWL